jgi:hypothetical protein
MISSFSAPDTLDPSFSCTYYVANKFIACSLDQIITSHVSLYFSGSKTTQPHMQPRLRLLAPSPLSRNAPTTVLVGAVGVRACVQPCAISTFYETGRSRTSVSGPPSCRPAGALYTSAKHVVDDRVGTAGVQPGPLQLLDPRYGLFCQGWMSACSTAPSPLPKTR